MSNQKKTAVALGLFDGVHQGHRAVLQAALRQKKQGLMPAAFTFHSEMAAVKGAAGFIYPTDLKTWIMESECGMEQIFAPPFELVSGLSGDDFARKILHEHMNAAFVACGQDFRFGKGGSGDVRLLGELCAERGIGFETVPPVCVNGVPVSSTLIRELIRKGDVAGANEQLGHRFSLELPVLHGKRLGRTIGFPTINQVIPEFMVHPKHGVYASRAFVDGTAFPAITDIGVKPTVGSDGSEITETHLIGFSGDLYGKKVRIELIRFIREEKKFSGLDELKAQLETDRAFAEKNIFTDR